MADEPTLGNVEVRRIPLDVGETGAGVENRTDYEYALGAEVDGVFVPFVTKSGGYIDHRAATGTPTSSSSSSTTTPDQPATETNPTPSNAGEFS